MAWGIGQANMEQKRADRAGVILSGYGRFSKRAKDFSPAWIFE